MATYTRPDATYPAVAEDAGRTAMSPADVGAGWSTSSQTRPPAATFNAKDYITSSAVKYLCRLGIAEYSPTESYQGMGLCCGSNGSVYWNLIACTGINPVGDVSGHWEKTAIRRADCAELIGNVTGGTIPETLNLLKGNGTGSAADSGITDDGTTTTFPMNVVVNGLLTIGSHRLHVGDLGSVGSSPSIGSDGASLDLSCSTTGWLTLNWTSGPGGVVHFGNGAGGSVGSVDTAGNAIFNGSISACNGNISLSYSGSARVAASTGNLVLDAGGTSSVLFNYFTGTGGVVFLNGAGGQVGSIDNLGNAVFSGAIYGANIHALNPSGVSGTVTAKYLNLFDPNAQNGMFVMGQSYAAGPNAKHMLMSFDPTQGIGANGLATINVVQEGVAYGSLDIMPSGGTWTIGRLGGSYIYGDGGSVIINSNPSTGIYLLRDSGYAVSFGNGAGGAEVGRIDINGNLTMNGSGHFGGGITTGGIYIGNQSPNFSFTDDGATSFIDGGGSGGRLYLNYNRTGGLVDVSGSMKIEISNKTYGPTTFQDATGSRAFGIPYTNSTGMSLQVSVSATTSGSSTGSLSVYLNYGAGFQLVWQNENTASVSGAKAACLFTVPNGWQYQVNQGGNITGIGSWVEWSVP